MNHGSLFSGMGGFDLAAEWMGWNNSFHCEWNPFGQKILKHYWPKAKSYEDITKTDFSIWRGRINILSGGFPCQPYSQAGNRLGKEDDRHLWPEMLRAIREIKPDYVVGENVLGITNWNEGLVFEEVQTDMEAEGYEVQAIILPAAGVNAPHRRDRVWFVAHSNGSKQKNNKGADFEKEGEVRREEESDVPRELSSIGTSTNTNNKRLQSECKSKGNDKKRWKEKRRCPEQHSGNDWRALPTETWKNFPTVSPVCNGNDGIPSRLDSITFPKWRIESVKAGGNAIVPQVALQIFKAIEKTELCIKQ